MPHLNYTPRERDKDVLSLGKIKNAVQNGHRMEALELLDLMISKIRTLQLVDNAEEESEKAESIGGDNEPTESVGGGTAETEEPDISPQSGSEQAESGEESYYDKSEPDTKTSKGEEE